MKKKNETKKLPLKAEQVRKLTQEQLNDVVGGALNDGAGGSGPTHK